MLHRGGCVLLGFRMVAQIVLMSRRTMMVRSCCVMS